MPSCERELPPPLRDEEGRRATAVPLLAGFLLLFAVGFLAICISRF